MAKPAKPKDKASKGTQKKHNSKNRGINTKKKGTLWESYTVKYKDKKGEEHEYVKDIVIPPNLRWDMFDTTINDEDKASAPFDALHYDWCEHIMQYAADYNAKIGKVNLSSGRFLYRVYIGGNVQTPKWLLLEVESHRVLTIQRKGKKKSRGSYDGNSNSSRGPSTSNNSVDSDVTSGVGSQEASK